MRKATRRQLEVLEREERSDQRKHQSAFETLAFLGWKVLLAYHLGDLEQDEQDPGEAEARALKYDSRYDYLEALFNGGIADINKRFMEAAHRLFGHVNLDFDRSSRRALSQAFVTLVNQLPEPWSQWIESNSQLSRNSRVFTQIGNAALPGVRISDHLHLSLLQREESKVCFWAFRRYTRPRMKVGWWQYEVANELQRFYCSRNKGERPKSMLMAPPQHGKTEQITDFIAWLAGKQPELKTIFASYGDELGVAVNMGLQRIMTSERYIAVFGHRLGESGSRWARNSNTLEYANHRGSFYNTTVGGQITGKGLDIGIVDDPIKGRAEANSKAVRDKVWQWFTDDFFTRFSDSAGLLIIMTRWHLDDPVGRLIEPFSDAKILRYPAIAEEDEKNRLKGEALFPQHKSAMFLLERKRAMTEGSWQSEYQQNPIIVGGGIFPIDKLTTVPIWDHSGIRKSVRYWDKAATVKDDAAYTSGVLMHLMQDNQFVVEHVARGHWSAMDRERIIREWAERDRQQLRSTPYEVVVEQEPGSGGKESAEATIRNLIGFRCFADRVTGNKVIRAEPFAAQVQGGNVRLVAGNWHYAYLDELESFPNGKFKDQVDASSGAFARLTSKPAYNLDAMAT